MSKRDDKTYKQSSWDRDFDRERLLKKTKKKSEEEEAYQKAEELGYSYLDLNIFPIDQLNMSFIPEEDARKLGLVVLKKTSKKVKLGALNPESEEVKKYLKDLKKKTGVEFKIYVVSRGSIEKAWEEYKFSTLKDRIESLAVSIGEEEMDYFKEEIRDLIDLEKRISEVSTTKILNIILAGAIKLEASDIHLEPQKDQEVRLRYRIDGVLQTTAKLPSNIYPGVVSRIKLLSGMTLNIDDAAQDGRFSVKLSERENIDVRVSLLPGNYGESMVMRLLDQGLEELNLDSIGLRGLAHERLLSQTEKTKGVIVNSGPTGSGKTTTLYSILNKLNTAEKKIITIEDPVEYKLPGVVQTQVNSRHGYTFASGLRSIVRQDPDIILVGEIRDEETANIAMQSAMTGHLVLTTVHANSSAAVISRLMDLGLGSNEIAGTINSLIAQRLVRKLCPHCKEKYRPAKATIKTIKKMLSLISPKAKMEVPKKIEYFYRAKGCPYCKGLGYKGRTGIFEILSMSESIKEKILNMETESEITKQALEEGMITMMQDGILKALEGHTSLKELQRVTGKEEYLLDLYEKIMLRVLAGGVEIEKKDYLEAAEKVVKKEDFQRMLKKSSIKEMIKYILAGGIIMRAGDVHLEPGEKTFRVRYRIDGVLQDMGEFDLSDYLSLLNQIKAMSGMGTTKRESGTSDGRFTINLDDKIEQIENERIAVRVSIILGGYGDIVVMRILDKSAKALDIDKIGFSEFNLKKLRQEITKPNGIIINTGPTGSGKTTTLYSILSRLNKPEVKIITVEDPIEYQIEGIIQTQTNQEEDYTFAKAMRSLLRQNPDIMMVGEIRDEETAQIAYRAALTGHLVVSTLHANSAAGSVQRLIDMGVDISDISSGTNCFIAQRLVRQLCPHCKKERKFGEERKKSILAELKSLPEDLKIELEKVESVFEPAGCSKCNGIGYKGMLPISEILQVDKEMESYFTQHPTTGEIEEKAIHNGMITLYQDGILKVFKGETSLEEVERVAAGSSN